MTLAGSVGVGRGGAMRRGGEHCFTDTTELSELLYLRFQAGGAAGSIEENHKHCVNYFYAQIGSNFMKKH